MPLVSLIENNLWLENAGPEMSGITPFQVSAVATGNLQNQPSIRYEYVQAMFVGLMQCGRQAVLIHCGGV